MLSFVMRSRAVAGGETTQQLLSRLGAGDSAALGQLYRREAGPVYRYALALCGNASWAADVTHDAFVALADRPAAVDLARGTLGAYLAGVARHGLLARWRDARGNVALPDGGDDGDALAAAEVASPETLLVDRQSRDSVWAALRELPWPFREALVLVDLQERPYAEAAAIAGIELNTLRTRVHRARSKLAQRLNAGANGAES